MVTLMGQTPLLQLLDEREERYEVLDGHIIVNPPARFGHERLATRLAASLLGAVPQGHEVLGPNFAVHCRPDSFLMPDLVVARSVDCEELGIWVPPLLVVEVLSPGTRRRDRGEKREVYAEFGIPHYWLLDPDTRVLETQQLTDAGYRTTQSGAVLEITEPFPIALDLRG